LGFNKKDVLKISFITILFLGLIITWLAFGERGLIHLYRMDKERQAYLKKIQKLENDNRKLMEQIKRLQNDKEYIESIARKELGLIKDNEIIFRFKKDQEKGED
jgi:cell division protein FtsB